MSTLVYARLLFGSLLFVTPFRFIVLPLQHSHIASLSLGISASFLMGQTSVHCISHSIQLLTCLSHFVLVICHLITQRTHDIIGRTQYIDHNAYELEPSALVSCFHPTSDIDHLVVSPLHQTPLLIVAPILHRPLHTRLYSEHRLICRYC
jgi:hypothetical protein